MNTMVVYDSLYGNTEKVAQAIAGAMPPFGAVRALRVGEANLTALESTDLLIVGSPTHGGRATPAIQEFINKIPAGGLKTVRVIAFDTRISAEDKGIGLRFLMRLLGYAAGRIANRLRAKGGSLAAPPAGFIVEGKEGPLKEGELERATAWAVRIIGQQEHALVAQQGEP
ncbi:MAG: flavodoxin family protein [Caldilineaceae bacterium]|nr:flavodoxin family protein [Caldilineaceae bacterium]